MRPGALGPAAGDPVPVHLEDGVLVADADHAPTPSTPPAHDQV